MGSESDAFSGGVGIKVGSREVLFDPSAISQLLELDPHPAHAFSRYPRKLEAAERAEKTYTSKLIASEVLQVLFVPEHEAADRAGAAKVEEESFLLLPSGKLMAATPAHPTVPEDESPSRLVAAIEQGRYRLRVVQEVSRAGPSEAQELRATESTEESQLTVEDRKALSKERRARRWHGVALFALIMGLYSMSPPTTVEGWFDIRFPRFPDWAGSLFFICMWPALIYLLRHTVIELLPSTRRARRSLKAIRKAAKESRRKEASERPSMRQVERVRVLLVSRLESA